MEATWLQPSITENMGDIINASPAIPHRANHGKCQAISGWGLAEKKTNPPTLKPTMTSRPLTAYHFKAKRSRLARRESARGSPDIRPSDSFLRKAHSWLATWTITVTKPSSTNTCKASTLLNV